MAWGVHRRFFVRLDSKLVSNDAHLTLLFEFLGFETGFERRSLLFEFPRWQINKINKTECALL